MFVESCSCFGAVTDEIRSRLSRMHGVGVYRPYVTPQGPLARALGGRRAFGLRACCSECTLGAYGAGDSSGRATTRWWIVVHLQRLVRNVGWEWA